MTTTRPALHKRPFECWRIAVTLAIGLLFPFDCHTGSRAESPASTWLSSWRTANPVWRGIHLGAHSDRDLDALIKELPKLAAAGANAIVLEVNYSFDFQSHPELRPPEYITKARAQDLARVAH